MGNSEISSLSIDEEDSFIEMIPYDSETVAKILSRTEFDLPLPKIHEHSISIEIPCFLPVEPLKTTHTKFSPDNMLRKIQIHFFNFIISFLNEILENLNYEQRFLKLNYNFKKTVNKGSFKRFKKYTLKDIIINQISDKYTKYYNNTNRMIYEEIKENEILKNVLSINCLMLFKTIYYKSNKKIDLSEYGINQEIILSKEVKMFNDLLKKIKKNGELYIKNIVNCTIKNFIPDFRFLIN